jgi:hypothetical protein
MATAYSEASLHYSKNVSYYFVLSYLIQTHCYAVPSTITKSVEFQKALNTSKRLLVSTSIESIGLPL